MEWILQLIQKKRERIYFNFIQISYVFNGRGEVQNFQISTEGAKFKGEVIFSKFTNKCAIIPVKLVLYLILC